MKTHLATLFMAAGLLAACGDNDSFQNEVPAPAASSEPNESLVPPISEEAVAARSKVLISMCIAEGVSESECTCQIKAVEDALEHEDFLKLIDLAEQGDEDGAESMLTDIMSDNPGVAMRMAGDMLKCAQD